MKRIRGLAGPTPGLADYLDCEGGAANWDRFRSHQAGAAYRELLEALQDIQHRLCGYCEIDLIEADRQVEHVVPRHPLRPRKDPPGDGERDLDAHNLIACCRGGTLPFSTADEERRRDPVKHNRSCGEAKGNSSDPAFLDPRSLPTLPLMRVRMDGRIEADEDACTAAGVPVRSVRRTIGTLCLNVERLRRARARRWRALNANWGDWLDDAEVLAAAARAELLPDDAGRLPRFFTTSRSFFGPLGERVLAEEPRGWL